MRILLVFVFLFIATLVVATPQGLCEKDSSGNCIQTGPATSATVLGDSEDEEDVILEYDTLDAPNTQMAKNLPAKKKDVEMFKIPATAAIKSGSVCFSNCAWFRIFPGQMSTEVFSGDRNYYCTGCKFGFVKYAMPPSGRCYEWPRDFNVTNAPVTESAVNNIKALCGSKSIGDCSCVSTSFKVSQTALYSALIKGNTGIGVQRAYVNPDFRYGGYFSSALSSRLSIRISDADAIVGQFEATPAGRVVQKEIQPVTQPGVKFGPIYGPPVQQMRFANQESN